MLEKITAALLWLSGQPENVDHGEQLGLEVRKLRSDLAEIKQLVSREATVYDMLSALENSASLTINSHEADEPQEAIYASIDEDVYASALQRNPSSYGGTACLDPLCRGWLGAFAGKVGGVRVRLSKAGVTTYYLVLFLPVDPNEGAVIKRALSLVVKTAQEITLTDMEFSI
jgi:hypothetical protein